MEPIDGPLADQKLAGAMATVDRMVDLTRRLYERTEGESQSRRMLGIIKILREIHEERIESDPLNTIWLPALAGLLLRAADPHAETLKALEEL